ncbi:hypothetical protein [Paludibacterium denitrificans]|uniref:Uncharacterized protein n=1 Tax=Paludibacterium denitrificans TaxID=2675226 RepID=A0A844GAL9_9NEIS|nr:hypothetical protein [Paludibacterium denitrificans]MTD32341.1 hypothetical protein [Paludibacterium denitrificans]
MAETSPETPAVATLAEPEASAMSAAPAAIERPAVVEPKPASVPPVDKPVTLSRPRTETGPTKADAAVPVASVSKPIVPLPVVELPTAPRDALPPQRPSQTKATARETITLPTAPSPVTVPPAPPPEIVQLPKHYRLKKTIPASTPLPKDLPVIGREELQANLQSSPLLRRAQRKLDCPAEKSTTARD